MIFVTVGGMRPFERLITEMDRIAGRLNEKVIMQIGSTGYEPRNCEYVRFMSRDDIEKLYSSASLIVCHAGVGSILAALKHNKRLVLVPRMKRYGEHIDDHQLEIAREMEGRGMAVVYDMSNLQSAVENASLSPVKFESEPDLVRRLRDYLNQLQKQMPAT